MRRAAVVSRLDLGCTHSHTVCPLVWRVAGTETPCDCGCLACVNEALLAACELVLERQRNAANSGWVLHADSVEALCAALALARGE